MSTLRRAASMANRESPAVSSSSASSGRGLLAQPLPKPGDLLRRAVLGQQLAAIGLDSGGALLGSSR
ncbi:MAG: hypothetical protein ABIZ05_06390 [Pseudonocardiaceae bacterium]